MKTQSKKRVRHLTHAALIAALYVALTYLSAFLGLSGTNAVQLRFSEALCILPLFTSAAIPGLFLGCLLSNLLTTAVIWDILFGSLATLLGALGTFAVGKGIQNTPLKIFLGGLFPILTNSVIIPLVIVFLCGGGEGYASVWTAYFVYAGSIALTETVWVYALGLPMILSLGRMRDGGASFLN